MTSGLSHDPLSHACAGREAECERLAQSGGTSPLIFRPRERRRLLWALALTGAMMVAEAVYGFLTGSLALLSDAGHMLTHAMNLAVSYLAIRIASTPTSPERSYGLYRTEVLAALFHAVTLFPITVLIVWKAVERFRHPVPIDSQTLLVVALLGLAVNLATALILYRAGHESDLNMRGAFLHMLGDTISSVLVVAMAAAINLKPSLAWLDPLASVLIAALIFAWGARLLRDSVHVLLEAAPRHILVEDVRRVLSEDPEVRRLCRSLVGSEVLAVHDVHIWEITSRMYALTAHITVSDHLLSQSEPLLRRMREILSSQFGIAHTVFELERQPSASGPEESP